jgi:hypothetical protein
MSPPEIAYRLPWHEERCAAALLLSGEGRVVPLFQGGGRDHSVVNLTAWRGVELIAEFRVLDPGEPLEVCHAYGNDPHPAGWLGPDCSALVLAGGVGKEIRLIRTGDDSPLATLGESGWVSDGFRLPCSDLIIAPASYFAAGVERTWLAALPCPRTRLSSLAHRELLPC